MFLKGGISFAMGNASDAVKKRATYTTSSNEEDGVASAIDKILALA
jgi:hydroxymethylpyrimidine pyrophosphatase-like HAD family hydrolase